MARKIPPLDEYDDGAGFDLNGGDYEGIGIDSSGFLGDAPPQENVQQDTELFEDEEYEPESQQHLDAEPPIGSGGEFSGFGNSGSMTQEDVFTIISGKNEIPPDLKKEFFPLLANSIQYNNIQSKQDLSVWGIRVRSAIRKYQMTHPNDMVDTFTQSQIEFASALNFNRAILGFERKMSVTNLSGIMQDQKLDAAAGNKKKGGFLSGLFGR